VRTSISRHKLALYQQLQTDDLDKSVQFTSVLAGLELQIKVTLRITHSMKYDVFVARGQLIRLQKWYD
jgi:hypothetical protein